MNAIRYTRIPFVFLLALLFTAMMFSALNGLTSAPYVPAVINSQPIRFTTVRDDTETQDRREITKPVKQDEIDIEPPRITGLGTEGMPQTMVRLDPPKTVVPSVDGKGVAIDRDVTPMVRVEPVYPERASARSIEGWVRVRFNISATGSVTDLEVVASEPSGVFEKAATAAVARWRYNPKVENGVAVERRGIENILRFTLPDK